MRFLLIGLIFSGLFFSNFSIANSLCPEGTPHPAHGCIVPAPKQPAFIVSFNGVAGSPSKTLALAFESFAKKYNYKNVSTHNDGNCTSTTTTTRTAGLIKITSESNQIDFLQISSSSTSYSPNTVGYQCPSSPPSNNSIPQQTWATKQDGVEQCPPDAPYDDFGSLVTIDGKKYCSKPAKPLDCSALAGLSSVGTSFLTDKDAGYTHPSCSTKCAVNDEGVEQCGNCKVVAKSWTQNSSSTSNMIKWTPLVGTFTGASCADDEQEKPPAEKPTCWKTKNNLEMCQADPDKECKTVNGVRSCNKGCGEINGDFWCSKVEDKKRDNNKDGDKPLPEIDDNISNPEKNLQDMQKGDFKDVLKGVETRINASNTSIGNLENSVDTVNNTLLDIKDSIDEQTSTEEAQTDQLGQINSKLGDIADGLANGGGDGDGDGGGDGQCDPSKQDCDDTGGDMPCEKTDAGNCVASSWWESKYKDGIKSVWDKNYQDLSNTQLMRFVNDPVDIPAGSPPPSQMCIDFGFVNFGCHDFSLPPVIFTLFYILTQIMAVAIGRKMIIGG